jgi:Predicted Fe-S-cluster oxidoreductase
MVESFQCTGCGHCCEGKGGIIVSPSDLERLAGHMGLAPKAFSATFGEEYAGKLRLRVNDEGLCVFYVQGVGCGVHVAKPDICRAWPYFRGNLVDSESLALARDFCPGIPKDIAFETFVVEGLAYLQENGLVSRGGKGEANALNVADIVASATKK